MQLVVLVVKGPQKSKDEEENCYYLLSCVGEKGRDLNNT